LCSKTPPNGPDGIPEMADLSGLMLTVAAVRTRGCVLQTREQPGGAVGISSRVGSRRIRGAPSVTWQSPIDILSTRLLRRSSQIGETAIYVLTKPA
jgi:hypothetical protein